MSSLNNGQYGGGPSSSATMAGGGGHWTDSLPRRDFYSNIAPTGTQFAHMLKSAEKFIESNTFCISVRFLSLEFWS